MNCNRKEEVDQYFDWRLRGTLSCTLMLRNLSNGSSINCYRRANRLFGPIKVKVGEFQRGVGGRGGWYIKTKSVDIQLSRWAYQMKLVIFKFQVYKDLIARASWILDVSSHSNQRENSFRYPPPLPPPCSGTRSRSFQSLASLL